MRESRPKRKNNMPREENFPIEEKTVPTDKWNEIRPQMEIPHVKKEKQKFFVFLKHEKKKFTSLSVNEI